jgi:hypothetical protein
MSDHESNQTEPTQNSGNETDPRFPTGPWTGFWLQREIAGRQMMRLHLAFADGKVTGADMVGKFTITGAYELVGGQCRFSKVYPTHIVEYDGKNEGDGNWLWGLWTIRAFDKGGFHIWPLGEDDPTQKKLRREKDLPANAEKEDVRVLVPAVGE